MAARFGGPSFGGVAFGIEDEGRALIGYTRLKRIEPEDRCPRFGILLARDHWDQGYGTEATRTLLRFAFAEMDVHRVELGVVDWNPRAIRAYEKYGFVLEGRRREARWRVGRWTDMLSMAILDREFWAMPQPTSA